MLEDALTRVPGLAGYLAKGRYDQQAQAGELSQLNNIAALSQHIQQQQTAAADTARMAKLRDVLSNLTPEQRKDQDFMYGLAIQNANPKDFLASVVKAQHDAALEKIKSAAGGNTSFAKIDPSKFTPESVAQFRVTGNHADLRADRNAHFADTGSGIVPLDPRTGVRINDGIPKSVTPDAQLGNQWNQFRHTNPSAAENFDRALRGQQHTFETGMTPPAMQAPASFAPPMSAPAARPAISGVPQARNSFKSTPSETDRPQVLRDELAAEQAKLAEYQRKNDQPNIERSNVNIASLGRELAALGVPSQVTAPQSPTAPASTIGGIPPAISGVPTPRKLAEIAGNQEEAKVKDIKMSAKLLEAAKEAKSLLELGPTGSWGGAALDQVARFGGMATAGGKIASRLETLGGWMTLNVPRMEGPQSNADLANYREMAARVGDRTVPVEERLSAVDELMKLQNKYRELNGHAPVENTPTLDKARTSTGKIKNAPPAGFKPL